MARGACATPHGVNARTSLSLLFIAAACTLLSCAYTVRTSSLPPHLKTVAIPVFENSTTEYRLEQELIGRHVQESDAVITTALIPGRPAPVLITADAVRGMRPGSVIVDLAAEAGGNCELTKPGETIVENGVTIVGELNLPSSMPLHASQMYSRNVWTFLDHLLEEGELRLDFEDEITRETCVTHEGRVLKEAAA